MKLGIVRAFFNKEYTEEMLDTAKQEADRLGVEVTHILQVPGAHDMPVAVKTLLEKPDVDAVATLGTVIKGGTAHDEILCQNLSKQLMELSCEYNKPVGFGVIGPNASWAQVKERTETYAKQAVDAAVDCHNELQDV